MYLLGASSLVTERHRVCRAGLNVQPYVPYPCHRGVTGVGPYMQAARGVPKHDHTGISHLRLAQYLGWALVRLLVFAHQTSHRSRISKPTHLLPNDGE